MLNVTSRLAVPVVSEPPWDVDWNDTTPQRPHSTLTAADILPGQNDGLILRKRAILQFLVREFDSLSDLQEFVPDGKSPHPRVKGNAELLKILFLDEKYIENVIIILSQFHGRDQVHETMMYKLHIIFLLLDNCWRPTIMQKRTRVKEMENVRTESLEWAREVPGIVLQTQLNIQQ